MSVKEAPVGLGHCPIIFGSVIAGGMHGYSYEHDCYFLDMFLQIFRMSGFITEHFVNSKKQSIPILH